MVGGSAVVGGRVADMMMPRTSVRSGASGDYGGQLTVEPLQSSGSKSSK